MGVLDIPLRTLDGEPTTLGALGRKALLVVNVASRCGLAPQYTGLERRQERYAARGFSIAGFPCNRFAGQEPGTAEEIRTFCSTTYDVSFPMFKKFLVDAEGRVAGRFHPRTEPEDRSLVAALEAALPG